MTHEDLRQSVVPEVYTDEDVVGWAGDLYAYDVRSLMQEWDALRAESERLRGERDAAQRSLVETGAILDWVGDALHGEEVSEFAESMAVVTDAMNLRRERDAMREEIGRRMESFAAMAKIATAAESDAARLRAAVRNVLDATKGIEHKDRHPCHYPGLCGKRKHLAFCDTLDAALAAARTALDGGNHE